MLPKGHSVETVGVDRVGKGGSGPPNDFHNMGTGLGRVLAYQMRRGTTVTPLSSKPAR